MKISIFIPVFNEEDTLEQSISLIECLLSNFPYEYEIFIVDDGSGDRSPKIGKEIELNHKDVRYLRYDFGPTRRENLAQSFKESNSEIIVFVDLDLVTNLQHLPYLIKELSDGIDIVVGSRYIKGAKIKRKILRLIISVLYNAWIRFMFKTNIRDHECGFKAFRKKTIIQLVNEMGFDRSLRRGIFWDAELLLRALRHGYKIKETPVCGMERYKSALNFQREIRMFPYIFKFLREEKLRNKNNKINIT